MLDPFKLSAVVEVIEAALDGPVDALTAARLHSRSGGNALVLRELVLEGLASGRLRRSGAQWRWAGPMRAEAGLRELVLARFSGLADDELSAVRLVALAEPVETDVMATIVDAAILDRLCRLGMLIEEDALSGPVLRLPHPLHAEALTAALGTAPGRRLRLRLADALERIRPADRVAALRRIRLKLDAGEHVEDHELLDAAEHALTLLDGSLAERLAKATVTRSRHQVTVLGRALVQQDRAEEAEAVLGGYLSGETEDESGEVTLLRASNLVFKLAKPEEALNLLDAAEQQHGALAAIEASRVAPLTYLGRYREAEAAFTRVLSQGTSVPELAFAAGCAALVDLGHQNRVVALVESALGSTADPVERLALRLVEGGALFYLGDLAAAEQVATELRQWAAVTMWPGAMGYATTLDGVTALARGRYRTARASLRDAVGAMGELDVFSGASWPLMSLAVCEAACGDHLAADEAVRRARATRGLRLAIRFHAESDEVDHAFVLASRGWAHTATEMLGSLVARCADKGLPGSGIAAANLLARLGQPQAAARGLNGFPNSWESATTKAHAAHIEGLAGRSPDALLVVSEQYEQLTMWHLAAEAADAAASLLAHRPSREAAFARTRRDALLSQCETGPMPWWPSTPSPDLTPREREVAQLAADGLTNAGIAGQLGVSPRTVENHLQRVYGKLGITGRAQLAAVAPVLGPLKQP